MRASRILQHRQERGFYALAQLCEERDDSQTRLHAAHNTLFVPPRLSFPPQTPYSVGSNSFRPNGASARDRLSPPRQGFEEVQSSSSSSQVIPRSPPEHMAPKRTKYTSPPPPEAPNRELVSFESRLDEGLSLATAATDAREEERAYMSSSSNSELLSEDSDIASDVAQEDDAKSVQSFTGEPSNLSRVQEMRSFFVPSSVPQRMSGTQLLMAYQQAKIRSLDDHTPTPLSYFLQGPRGRKAARQSNEGPSAPPIAYHGLGHENLRRSNSGPARSGYPNRLNFGTAVSVPLPASPVTQSITGSPTIYYETNAPTHRGASAGGSSYSPSPVASPVNPLTLYQQQYYLAHAHAQAQAQAHGQSHYVSEASPVLESVESFSPSMLTETSQAQTALTRPVHSHTHSSSTIVGPPTPGASSFSLSHLQASGHQHSQQSSPSQSPSPTHSTFRRSTDFSHPNISPTTSFLRPVPSSNLRSSVRLDLSVDESPELEPAVDAAQPAQSPTSPLLSSASKHMTRRQHEFQSPSEVIPSDQLPSEGGGVVDKEEAKPSRIGELKIDFGVDHSYRLQSSIDSPPSSNSSRGDSASGYAVSPGLSSPVSSASPRTADLGSPCASSSEAGQTLPQHQQKPSLDVLANQLHHRQEDRSPPSRGHGRKESSQTNLSRLVASLREQREVSVVAAKASEKQSSQLQQHQPPSNADAASPAPAQSPTESPSAASPQTSSSVTKKEQNEAAALGARGLRRMWGSMSSIDHEEISKIDASSDSTPRAVEETRS